MDKRRTLFVKILPCAPSNSTSSTIPLPAALQRTYCLHLCRHKHSRNKPRRFPDPCRGELIALQSDCVHLGKEADANGFWGTIELRSGLKRKERRRDLPIPEDM